MATPLQWIDSVSARTHGWQPVRQFWFAQQLPALQVSIAELAALVPNAPLAFAKVADDRFTLAMLTGFADGRNQLVDDQGRWLLQYLPLELQAYPFALQPVPHTEGVERTLGMGFNHASGLYREAPNAEAGEQRFFTDDGQQQPLFKRVLEHLQKQIGQQQLTQRAVAALQQAQLLTPWQIQPREGHTDELLPKGLYRIDEPKLQQLQAQELETLHKANAIALAYGQLLSMGRTIVLQRLKDTHAARRAPAAPAPDLGVVQKMFEPGKPDTVQFNW
jgi:hypothetical protein